MPLTGAKSYSTLRGISCMVSDTVCGVPLTCETFTFTLASTTSGPPVISSGARSNCTEAGVTVSAKTPDVVGVGVGVTVGVRVGVRVGVGVHSMSLHRMVSFGGSTQYSRLPYW